MMLKIYSLLAYAGYAVAIQCYQAKVGNGWECANSRRFYNTEANLSEVLSESLFDQTCCKQDACATHTEGLVLKVYNQCPAVGGGSYASASPSLTPSASGTAAASGTPSASASSAETSSVSARSTPPWCLQSSELSNCEQTYNCNETNPDCFCYKNKETDPLCAACHYNYCDQCFSDQQDNYKPVQQSRCINCADAHNIDSIDFVCTKCEHEKGCTLGTLNGQTKNSNEFQVFEMEWYQNDAGLWSLRKTTGVAVSTNHDYINHLEENGCTSERNSEGQCVTMTDTLFQLSWPGPTPAPTPTPSVSEGTVIVARSTPLKCQKVDNELVNCLNDNCQNVADADCVCYKDKEIDTKCQNCNDNGCGGCYNSNTNYQPFQKSPCVDCATAHSGTDGFVCTQCQQGKGCTQGTLNDQTKYSQDMKVYEMEWYITSTGEWSVRKTDGVFISTDQNYINNVQNNGCTDNNCSEFTETLYQTSW